MTRAETFGALTLAVSVVGALILIGRSDAAPLVQIPTGGNTLGNAGAGGVADPFYGPDADPFLGVYTGALL